MHYNNPLFPHPPQCIDSAIFTLYNQKYNAMAHPEKTHSDKGRHLHHQAEISREAGDFLKALHYTDEAALAYQADGDYLGLAEVQASRQSTFKHLYRSTGDPVFLTLEMHAAQASVEIAEKSGDKKALGIPYHNLGKSLSEAGKHCEAADAYKKAVTYLTEYPLELHSRPSVIADIKGHLYTAEFFCGDHSALNKALRALENLEAADEDSYNKNVWLSGAHLRIAEMYMSAEDVQDHKQRAEEHIKQAEEIINGDERLVLRREQLEEIKHKFAGQ